jgi:thymidylate kinase
MSAAPLLIAITGADGSGKSTACAAVRARLAERLGAEAVAEVSVWDCLSEQAGVMPAFRNPEEASRYLVDLDGTSRTLFIFHALARALQLGLRKQPRVVLLNGYWYKYAVSEIGYGVDPEFVLGAALGFARPAHVFCLDVDPATAWERRLRASRYEQGAAAADATAGGAGERERFVRFQQKLASAWSGIEAQTGLAWEHLSALEPADEVAGRITEGVLLRLPRPAAGGHA